MARMKTNPDTAPSAAHAATDPAPSAAHAATDPAPVPGTAPTAGSPAAAVSAALAAKPASAVADIADAAGTGKPAARAVLLAMEKDGTATRVKGTRPNPDTWTLAGPGPDGTNPAETPEPAQPGQDAGGSPDGAAEDETTDGTGQQDRTGEAGDGPAPQDGGEPEAGTAPGPETEQPGPRDDGASADAGHEDAAPDERSDDETAPDSGGEAPAGSDEPAGEDAAPADGDSGGEAVDEPDPALVTGLTGQLDQVRAAADAAELVLTASGDLNRVLAGLDEIYEQAAQARRSLKAAIGGRKTPAARPGTLRDKVLAHLDAHPGGEFTPHEIHKVNGHSSGAIANALETLVKHGEAEVATEKPRRFRRVTQPAEAAPGAAGAASPEDSTELAGAA